MLDVRIWLALPENSMRGLSHLAAESNLTPQKALRQCRNAAVPGA